MRQGSSTVPFKVFSWVMDFLFLVALLTLGIGLGNLIPIGPIDGGRMMHLAVSKIAGEKEWKKSFLVFVNIGLLFVILALLYPIVRETFNKLFG